MLGQRKIPELTPFGYGRAGGVKQGRLPGRGGLGPETPSHRPAPPFASSCLIAMALKNSKTGSLPVSEIYSFMKEHFPYFKVSSPSLG